MGEHPYNKGFREGVESGKKERDGLLRQLSEKRDTVARMKKLAVSIHDRALSGANARDAAEVYFTTAPIL